MPARRVPLVVPRAAARIKVDAWDDLWPDAIGLARLPSESREYDAARRRLERMRRGTAIPKAREGLVPKPNGLMRPGHVLALDSRLYYQALVDSFMYDLDKRLVGKNHVFGYRPLAPRSTNAPFGFGLRQWRRYREQLRREVASGKYGAFVRTDLTAFFERIPHGSLEERLTSLGVRPDVAHELRTFLKATMGRGHGLPQGPDPSGVLASAYLHSLDQAIIGAGYGYVRYVDDIVILARSQTDAKKSLRLLERECRHLDLIVQSAKTEIVVGQEAMMAAVGDDDEIAAVDYVIKRRRRPEQVSVIRRTWRRAGRQAGASRRLVKYLLGRLTDNRDPIAIPWCLARLGELDYLAPTVARYLSLFASRPKLQEKVGRHLESEENLSEWEEMSLLRAMLSARRVERSILARARHVAADRNLGIEVRQYALLVLGRHGDGSDHHIIGRECLDDRHLAEAAVLALHGSAPLIRGRVYADVGARYPELRPLITKLKGQRAPKWPVFT